MTPSLDPTGEAGRPRSTRSDSGGDPRRGPGEKEFRILAPTPGPGEESDVLAEILETQEQILRRINDNRAVLMAILGRLEAREASDAARTSETRYGRGSRATAPRREQPAGRLTGLSDSGVDDYDVLVARVRTLVRAVIPAGSTVLMVSRGDEELLRLDGRRAWHFPSSAGGRYAGYHPADDEEAIAHLSDLVRQGAEYLVIPRTAFWWLEHYSRFRTHLEASAEVVARDETACVVLSLGSSNGDPRPAKESW